MPGIDYTASTAEEGVWTRVGGKEYKWNNF